MSKPVEQHKCQVCGARHLPKPLTAIAHKDCKQVPEKFVWVDRKYKHGPRGALIDLKAHVMENDA